MTAALPTDIIVQRCHDKKWQYSGPIENLDEWVASNTDAFDPQIAHRMYWPDRPYPTDMEILVVDGGTTQAPAIARTNPAARVTATVASKESLDHAIYLKHKFRLDNMELRHLTVDDVSSINRTFDLVIASGTLQEAGYAEAQLGMKALAQVLRPDGVAAFLLYSRYLMSDSGSGGRNGEKDPFLHSSGVNFSVQDCLDLVEGAGLVFQDWLVKSPYYLPASINLDNEFLAAISRLPEWQMWSVMEPLRNHNGCHLFTACRPDRPTNTYRIDFDAPEALDYSPAWRLDARLVGRHAVQPEWCMPLDTVQLGMAAKIDGQMTIRQIAGQSNLNSAAKALFKELWRMDFVTVRIDDSATWFGADIDYAANSIEIG